MKKVAAVALALLFLGLLTTDRGVLVSEEIVREQGEGQSTLVCKYYFTARRTVIKKYWYATNNIMGRSVCDFIYKSNE
ncbi:MAG: hypothetical protein GY820_38270 [Gammaproteobacteria bacterium]|nr:hypothetical protein [Gammaproteobacteria bacterium]